MSLAKRISILSKELAVEHLSFNESLDESLLDGIDETVHLLGSPNNANRLMESIAQLRDGKAQHRELICK